MNTGLWYQVMVIIYLFQCQRAQGQRMTVHPYDHRHSSTECESGLLDQTDTYLFTGTVNISEVDIAARSVLVVQAQDRHTNEITTICILELHKSRCNRAIGRTACCANDTEDKLLLEIVVKQYADFILSCNVIRFLWLAEDNAEADLSNEVLMPKVFRKPHETLTINSILISTICEINQILSGLNYDLEWCVTNLERHILKISYRNSTLNLTMNDCVRYHLQPDDITVNSSFEISYAETGGCKRNNSYTCYFNLTKLVLEAYDQTRSITQCTYGLLEGQDRMLVTGYLNATTHELEERNFVQFQIGKSKHSEFSSICTIDFKSTPCSHHQPNTSDCYCHQVNRTLYRLTLNTTASLNYSQKVTRLRWASNDSGVFSNVETVPLIHVNSQIDIILQLDKIRLNPRNCSLELLHGASHKFTFCVYNLLHPVLRVTKYTTEEDQTPFVMGPCTQMMIRVQDVPLGSMYEFSYKELPGCNRHDNFTCTVYDIRPPEMVIAPDYSVFISILVLVGILSTASFIFLIKETLRVRHLKETHRPKSRHCTVISKTPTDARSEPWIEPETFESEPSKSNTRMSSVDTGEALSFFTRTSTQLDPETVIW